MKKSFSILLVVILLLSMSVVSFADEHDEITFEDVMELTSKYNLESVIVDESSLKDEKVIRNLTKEELESLIINGIEESSKPLYFEEEVYITDKSISPNINFSGDSLSNSLGDWEVFKKVATLSKTFYAGETKYLKLRASVAATYQFESKSINGAPDPIRNWKFTDADDGNIVHLNDGEYQLKKISSKTSLTDDVIKQEYKGVVDVGHFVGVGKLTVRISLGEQDFSGTLAYTRESL
ncbi:hypothetical protein EV204_1262 [Tissierella praeacuta]|uniref:hypothetical protein n=1 Tax=Tissierella praeacuta TaxID=43131 RepID=UPI001046372C|nr:hypothetical protein [Tissierella praeacuta]TCU64431.1 hypothetical protein EV204_1262 [Tissierella praeacuta]